MGFRSMGLVRNVYHVLQGCPAKGKRSDSKAGKGLGWSGGRVGMDGSGIPATIEFIKQSVLAFWFLYSQRSPCPSPQLCCRYDRMRLTHTGL
jgi:hypothetical protein